jgi:hypothetical protein
MGSGQRAQLSLGETRLLKTSQAPSELPIQFGKEARPQRDCRPTQGDNRMDREAVVEIRNKAAVIDGLV